MLFNLNYPEKSSERLFNEFIIFKSRLRIVSPVLESLLQLKKVKRTIIILLEFITNGS